MTMCCTCLQITKFRKRVEGDYLRKFLDLHTVPVALARGRFMKGSSCCGTVALMVQMATITWRATKPRA